jgi:hypothetical protein
MDYLVRRGEQQFGPYTLAEMQEYAQSGRILPADLAKSDGMTDWIQVSQILGNIPAPVAAPVSVTAPPVEPVPLPPNIHWLLLMVVYLVANFLSLLGTAIFWTWSIVMGNWARRLSGNNTALILAAIWPLSALCGGVAIGMGKGANNPAFSGIGGLLILAGIVLAYVAVFKVRAAMEEYYNTKENIALSLSGAMTFFFSYIYLQYHVNRIARWKKTGILT